MGPLGIPETIFIFVLALLMFGPKKLPELGRTFGKAMAEFRRASNELKATFDREMVSIEHETREIKEETQKYTNEIYNYDSYYDSGAYGSDPYHDSIDSNHSAAIEPSSVSASATQGAEPTAGTTAEVTDVAEAASHHTEHATADSHVPDVDPKTAGEGMVKS